MHLSSELRQQNCPRCQSKLTAPGVYREQSWWHAHCWQEGEHLLANAERIARAVNPALFIHETPTRRIAWQVRAACPLPVHTEGSLGGLPAGDGMEPASCAMAGVARRRAMDKFAHTDAAYLIADSILGELTFVRQALAAAGCERVYTSGDEAEALALIGRERIDLVLVAWDAYHDGLELLHELRRTPEHRQLPVVFIFEAAVEPERLARLQATGDSMLAYGVKPMATGALLHAISALFDKLSNL